MSRPNPEHRVRHKKEHHAPPKSGTKPAEAKEAEKQGQQVPARSSGSGKIKGPPKAPAPDQKPKIKDQSKAKEHHGKQKQSKKKHTKEEHKGGAVNDDVIEAVYTLPKMYPLHNEQLRKRPEAKREEVRTMKRMFDEGYAAMREGGAKKSNRLIVLNYIFFILAIVKMFSTIAMMISRIMLDDSLKFDENIVSSDFFFRVMLNVSTITLAFQVWLVVADAVLIHQMFKQDAKNLIFIFGTSFCLTFYILTLGALELSIGYSSRPVATGFVGSYLAAAQHPMLAAGNLSEKYGCCGFEGPLDWHRGNVFEWDSFLTDTTMTIHQNFSWIAECSEKLNTGPYDNYVCPLPSMCNITFKTPKTNVTSYSRSDLRLLIQEEDRLRSNLFPTSVLNEARGVNGCISALDTTLRSHNYVFIVGTVLICLVIPIQTFLVSIVFVNDNAIGRLVKHEGITMVEKLDHCSPLAFFKKKDVSMGVKHKKAQKQWSNEEE